MTMTPDDVRAAVMRARKGFNHEECPDDWRDCNDARTIADAVLNPPMSVREAIERRNANRAYEDTSIEDDVIADWITDLTTPAAKETT